MLLAHKSDLLYLSKGPFQSQTYTLYHLQPTPAKLSVTKLQAPRSPFPMLKGNETCTIASSQTLMAAQLNTHLNLHRRTHPPFPFFFFFFGAAFITSNTPLGQTDKMELLRWNDLPVEQEDTVLRAIIFHLGLTPSPKKS